MHLIFEPPVPLFAVWILPGARLGTRFICCDSRPRAADESALVEETVCAAHAVILPRAHNKATFSAIFS